MLYDILEAQPLRPMGSALNPCLVLGYDDDDNNNVGWTTWGENLVPSKSYFCREQNYSLITFLTSYSSFPSRNS